MADQVDSRPTRTGAGRGRGRQDRTVRASALAVSRKAVRQLAELIGRSPESVSMLTEDEHGWRLRIEVVELERVPQTTSVLATYEVQADHGGDVRSYRRINRYTRNQAGEL